MAAGALVRSKPGRGDDRALGTVGPELRRRFQKATGHAPLAYVQNLRIEHAKRMLENGTDPIDEISAAVGYEDASFFRRVFKRTVGLRPVDYRRKFAPSRLPGDVSDAHRAAEEACSAM
jgi:transcriptional regulator GlxA family with amidase domain